MARKKKTLVLGENWSLGGLYRSAEISLTFLTWTSGTDDLDGPFLESGELFMVLEGPTPDDAGNTALRVLTSKGHAVWIFKHCEVEALWPHCRHRIPRDSRGGRGIKLAEGSPPVRVV